MKLRVGRVGQVVAGSRGEGWKVELWGGRVEPVMVEALDDTMAGP